MSTEQPQSNRLYVGNIPWSTTVEELQGLFTDAENIEIPTVRFLLSFFCFYNFVIRSRLWETRRKTFLAPTIHFFIVVVASQKRALSEKPLSRETSENRSPKSAENKEKRDFARRERNAGGKVLRGLHSYCKKESEMRCHLAVVFRGRLLSEKGTPFGQNLHACFSDIFFSPLTPKFSSCLFCKMLK